LPDDDRGAPTLEAGPPPIVDPNSFAALPKSSMSSLGHRRSPKHEITMEHILSFIRCLKTKRYTDCPQLLYDIRTMDLREMLEDLGPGHLFYRSLLDVLKDPRHFAFHSEALYNLAVVLSRKQNVTSLLPLDVVDVVLPYADHSNRYFQYRACWCLFGIASSTPESREVCLRRGVLAKAIALALANPSDPALTDMCGQIIYGMFHMHPPPPAAYAQPFFDNCRGLLRAHDCILKYVLWSLHFCSGSSMAVIAKLPVSAELRALLHSQQVPILIPLLTVLGEMFRDNSQSREEYVQDLTGPLSHPDICVRVQASRTIADYAQDEKTIQDLLVNGLYEIMIQMSEEDDPRVREQAVYTIVRGFGLGSDVQKKVLAEIGGMRAVLDFATIAPQPFSGNLLDCLDSLAEEEDAYFTRKLKEIGAIPILYKLLSFPDQVLTSKASNLLGIVDDTHPQTS
jgi:hypothetical protein